MSQSRLKTFQTPPILSTSDVFNIRTDSNGNFYFMSDAESFGGYPNPNFYSWIWKISPLGVVDETFMNNLGTQGGFDVNGFEITSTDKLVVYGNFETWNGSPAPVNTLLSINDDGTFNTSYNTNLGTGFLEGDGIITYTSEILKVRVQPDNKMVVMGYFNDLNGASLGGLARLNADGTPDTTFNTNVGDPFDYLTTFDVPFDCTFLSDNSIVLIGYFLNYDSNGCAGIVKLNSSGNEDATFTANAGTGFDYPDDNAAITRDSNDNIFFGSGAASYNGTMLAYGVQKLSSAGVLNTTFNNNIGGYDPLAAYLGFVGTVYSIQIDSNDNLYVAGSFLEIRLSYDSGTDTYTTTPANNIALLDNDGINDTTFQTNMGTGSNENINQDALYLDEPNGYLYFGSDYGDDFDGNAYESLGRIQLDGTYNMWFYVPAPPPSPYSFTVPAGITRMLFNVRALDQFNNCASFIINVIPTKGYVVTFTDTMTPGNLKDEDNNLICEWYAGEYFTVTFLE